MIRTVLGDIPKEELGVTLDHEHFIVDLSRVRKDAVSKIDTIEEVVPEIREAMDQGVQAAFEMTTNDMGRDVRKLAQISERTGLKIVAGTGYYLQEYHPAWLADATAEQIADVYIRDLTVGIDGIGIRAGMMGEIASSKNGFTPEEKKCLVAAAIAHKATGAAISTHTGPATAVETIETLLDNGVQPDKIIIGHQDLVDDSDYHLNLLKYGVNIAFDTCGKKSYMPDEARAKNALKIIEEGYGDHLVFSNDISRKTYFTAYGGNGYRSVMGIVVPLLREYGASEEDIHKILVDNPARIVDNPRWN